MKRAQHVFARRMVNPRLAPDRRIDHCQERGRDLKPLNAALIYRSSKARHVAHHAPTQRNNQG